MTSYPLRKFLRRLLIALPRSSLLYSACRFYCNTFDGENFGDMTINGEHRFLRSVAADCQVVFDVGAHHGEWTEAVLRWNPRAVVHCFEPVPEAFTELTARHLPASAVRNRLALSSTRGTREFFVEVNSFHPRPRPGGRRSRKTLAVETSTLDAYCTEHSIDDVDLLKLDVEGHELETLKGGEEMLAAGRIGRVQFEYGPYYIYSQALFKDVFEYLRGFGYEIFKIVPRSLIPIEGYDERLENYLYKNFVAVRPQGRGSGPSQGPREQCCR